MALVVSGWRLGHVYLGIAILLVAVPMALHIPRRHSVAEGSASTLGQPPTGQGPLETQRWSEALRSAPLWQLNGSYFVCGMTVSLFSIHLIPFATDRGLPLETAAHAFGLMALCSVVGSLLAGVVADRIGRKNVLGLAYLIRAGCFALLLLWHHEWALYVFAVVGGLVGLATPPSTMALTGEIYGCAAGNWGASRSWRTRLVAAPASGWLASCST